MAQERFVETSEQFRRRVYPFAYHSIYLDDAGYFHTSGSLQDKVDADGTLKPYEGNTTVLILDRTREPMRRAVQSIERLQEQLYAQCSPMLAQKLQRDTLHMTLHDLLSGLPRQICPQELAAVGERARQVLERWKQQPWILRMRSTCMFNMVNTSIVLGLEPCMEADCTQLMQCYQDLEQVVPLRRFLTPHVTLAYYKPGSYHGEVLENLQRILKASAGEDITFEFCAQDLYYQTFSDMNHYEMG